MSPRVKRISIAEDGLAALKTKFPKVITYRELASEKTLKSIGKLSILF